ncbi:MAG: serine hydrolase [Anaerolineae bacterium]
MPALPDGTRRTFLRFTLLGAGSVVLAACGVRSTPDRAPIATAVSLPSPTVRPSPTQTSLPTATATLAPPPIPAMAKWRVTGYPFRALAGFDETMQRYMQQRNIPGGTLAVTRNGKLVLARGYTFSDDFNFTVQPTSLFRLASISKPITSAAVMQLVEQKKLELSATLTSLLKVTPPPGQRTDLRLEKITVLNLLQHLGGWDRDQSFDPMFRDEIIALALNVRLPIQQTHIMAYMAGQRLDNDPGTKFAYSNYGFMLLGRIVEKVAGQSYGDYVRANIFEPLRIQRAALAKSLLQSRLRDEVPYYSTWTGKTVMDNSGKIVPSPYGGFNIENMDSHGGWVMSAIDLVRFATAFDFPDSSPILTGNSIETIFAMPSVGASNGAYYGCGWEVRPIGNRGRNTWHNGSLPGTYTFLVRRFDGLNWAMLFNQRDNAADPNSSTYDQIDGMMHQAADAVTAWHNYDLFEEYL